jgi:hypothetical protein
MKKPFPVADLTLLGCLVVLLGLVGCRLFTEQRIHVEIFPLRPEPTTNSAHPSP